MMQKTDGPEDNERERDEKELSRDRENERERERIGKDGRKKDRKDSADCS